MSVQPVPPVAAATTAGQLAARATQNDQILAAALSEVEDRITVLESDSGTSGTVTSVNGVEPDESGNVVIPIGGGGGGGAGLTEDPANPGLYLIDAVQSVTAAAPTFTDADGTSNDRYVIPSVTGVEYRVNGAIRSAGTYTPSAGQSVTVTATALAGYTLTGTSTWSYTFSTGTAPVAVTANVPTADDSANTITWTPKTGVDYVIGGTVRTPPYSVGDVAATVTVTAQAQAGYTLTGTTSWTFTFTKAPTSPASDYAAAVTADAPVVFYRLNEASGTPVDSMGNSTATVGGTPTFGSTVLLDPDTSVFISNGGTGANFFGIGQPSGLNNLTAFTYEAIIRPATSGAGLVNRSNADTVQGLAITITGDGRLSVNIGGWNSATTVDKVAWNTPQHVAITMDGTNLHFYVNGVNVGTNAWTRVPFTVAHQWEIARQDSYQGGRNSWRGHMAGVALYNRALTAAEILAHAQAAGLAA